ncbi:hypothetical protein [Bradyrhizobium prioriisuperbiae]|uniref:hypothetical protein n=1 Tax=Bradyrhizobium prioriisuperbiae TaxID=2854389 RepID=UPI0028E3C3E3|nr:hypothetical protein [Bradyrhizobium prioritasuperba]
MKRVVKAVIGLLLIGFGSPLLFLGLTRLGWRRHGASPLDISLLHLDWIFQPQPPYWFAHMANLAVACAGLIAILAGASLLVGAAFRVGHTR